MQQNIKQTCSHLDFDSFEFWLFCYASASGVQRWTWAGDWNEMMRRRSSEIGGGLKTVAILLFLPNSLSIAETNWKEKASFLFSLLRVTVSNICIPQILNGFITKVLFLSCLYFAFLIKLNQLVVNLKIHDPFNIFRVWLTASIVLPWNSV